jgi:hypothetical protein
MLSLSKHGGQGLCARPFDKLRVTGRPAKCHIFRSHRIFPFSMPPFNYVMDCFGIAKFLKN